MKSSKTARQFFRINRQDAADLPFSPFIANSTSDRSSDPDSHHPHRKHGIVPFFPRDGLPMVPDIHMIVAGDAILQGFSRILLDLLLNLLCKFFLFPVAPLRPKSQK